MGGPVFLSQTWCGTVVLHLAACKNWGRIILEGSSFTGLPSGSSWARDKPPPVTWLPATVGTLCRQNAKWGASFFYAFDANSHSKFTCRLIDIDRMLHASCEVENVAAPFGPIAEYQPRRPIMMIQGPGVFPRQFGHLIATTKHPNKNAKNPHRFDPKISM